MQALVRKELTGSWLRKLHWSLKASRNSFHYFLWNLVVRRQLNTGHRRVLIRPRVKRRKVWLSYISLHAQLSLPARCCSCNLLARFQPKNSVMTSPKALNLPTGKERVMVRELISTPKKLNYAGGTNLVPLTWKSRSKSRAAKQS